MFSLRSKARTYVLVFGVAVMALIAVALFGSPSRAQAVTFDDLSATNVRCLTLSTKFSVYLRSGETLSLKGKTDTPLVSYEDTNADGVGEIAPDDGSHYYDAAVWKPNGTVLDKTTDTEGLNFGVGGSTMDFSISAPSDGVYTFQITGRPGWTGYTTAALTTAINASGTSTTYYQQMGWDFQVLQGTTPVLGRIWTDTLNLQQATNQAFTASLYTLSASGYMYQLDINKYMGASSQLRFGALGLIDKTTKNSINESVSMATSPTPTISNMSNAEFSTGGQYHIFFEEPNEDLPTEVEDQNGKMVPLKPQPIDQSGQPLGKVLGINARGTSKAPRAGNIKHWLTAAFSGEYTLQVAIQNDTNADGDYDDAGETSELMIPMTAGGVDAGGVNHNGSATDPISAYWNGLDAAGNPVPLSAKVSAKIYIESASSIYISMQDVEQCGGITLEQLNGSGGRELDASGNPIPGTGNTTVYFNDNGLLYDMDGDGTPDPTGEDNSGVLYPITESTAGSAGYTAPWSALEGTDSAVPGGTHGWFGGGGSRGDHRWIQTWMQSGFASAVLDATEGTIPTIAPTIHNDADGELSKQDLVNLTHAMAYDGNGDRVADEDLEIDQAQLDAINEAIADGRVGEFPITFTTPDGAEISTTVTLTNVGGGDSSDTNDDSILDTDLIGSNHFTYPDPAGAITKEEAKALGMVKAYAADGSPIPLDDITVDQAQLDAINAAIAAGKVGPYSLTYTTPDGTSSTSIVTLTNQGAGDPSTVATDTPNYDGTDRIGGNDFIYGIDQGQMSDEDSLLRGKVVARDADGNLIDPKDLTIDQTQLNAINKAIEDGILGDMPLTFTTPDGTKTTITVTLTGHGASTPDDPATTADEGTEVIAGNDFYHGIDQGPLTGDDIKHLGSVQAKDKLGNPLDLDEVAAGKHVTLTRHGKAAAKLVPVEQDFERDKVKQAVDAFLELRKGITLGGLSIKELINEGRP